MNPEGRMRELGDDFEKYLKHVFKGVEAPEEIIEAMEYSLFAGGKRLRPTMALYLAREFGISDNASLPLCAAIEMIHTYSLIHDDLPAMDDDDLRRGQPTSHVKFGEAMAILAGDGLLNYAFEMLLNNVPNENTFQYIRAAAFIAKSSGISGMVGGQVMDMNNAALTSQSLEKMHSLKTGRMFSACIMPMVYIAGLTPEDEKKYFEFSENFGLLFQITDDILDVTGETAKLGKTIGKDVDAGKITYVTKYGLDEARKMADEALAKCLSSLTDTGHGHAYLCSLVNYIRQRDK